ncbi:MAG: SGNH/GDSL hydrolase family protein [Candidatus Levybacteria bacterium]|nr:SGNH/GDSL hydrolase family protein [Candidatus Levybacteria bacterium]
MIKYFLIFMLLILTSIVLLVLYLKDDSKALLSATIAVSPTFIPTSIPTPSPFPTLTPTPSVVLKKSTYSIAIFGDSMVDTMGEELEHLEISLSAKYPKTRFSFYNYGIGGQNIEQGLSRFESSFVNRERNFPPLPVLSPDVLILGSFAYNPFSTHDRNKHYTLLHQLVAKAKIVSSHVYLLAEIAPLKTGFGEGKNGVNMAPDAAYQHALNIIEQLDNVINLSTSENIPLINAYHESRTDGAFGDPYLVNKDDGIHPSEEGHRFMADFIVNSIKLE